AALAHAAARHAHELLRRRRRRRHRRGSGEPVSGGAGGARRGARRPAGARDLGDAPPLRSRRRGPAPARPDPAAPGAPPPPHPAPAGLPPAGGARVDRTLADGDVATAGARRLRAVFTPGHTPGHHCFLDETTGFVLAGDMVAGVGTVVIDPDEGDMSEYLASIARMEALAARALLPAHGPILTEPASKLDEYRRHRLWREARVVAALARLGEATPAELTVLAYDDVPASVHALAERSLRAHLTKLVREGRAR